MNLTLDKTGALYDQIARAIKLEILEGRIAAESKLPSTRTLATALGVSRKSVLQAYDLLCAEELAVARGGSQIEIGPHQTGMHFVVWFRHLAFDRLDAFLDRAKSLGLGLHPVHPYYRARPSRPGLLVGYAGLSIGQLRTAVDLFARCLESE